LPKIEKDFLRVLMGGCSTPISALAEIKEAQVHFLGNICAPDGSDLTSIGFAMDIDKSKDMGEKVAQSLLSDPRAQQIMKKVRDGKQ
jgi:hydroxymethylbilane synthase